MSFEYVYRRDGVIHYRDGVKKNNTHIKEIFPKIYFVDHNRDKVDIREDFVMLQQDEALASFVRTSAYLTGLKNAASV